MSSTDGLPADTCAQCGGTRNQTPVPSRRNRHSDLCTGCAEARDKQTYAINCLVLCAIGILCQFALFVRLASRLNSICERDPNIPEGFVQRVQEMRATRGTPQYRNAASALYGFMKPHIAEAQNDGIMSALRLVAQAGSGTGICFAVIALRRRGSSRLLSAFALATAALTAAGQLWCAWKIGTIAAMLFGIVAGVRLW